MGLAVGWSINQLVAAAASILASEYVLVPASVPLVLLMLFGAIKFSSSKYATRPPSPWPSLPIIGHLLHVFKGMNVLQDNDQLLPPHVTLYNLSRKCGPLMGLRLGQQSVIVASSAAAAREILQTQDHVFAARPRLEVPVLLHGCADILFASPSDPHWKFLRHLFSSQFFLKRQLEAFRPVRLQEVRALLTSILNTISTTSTSANPSSSSTSTITIRTHAHSLTSNIICRMAFGKRLHDLAACAGRSWPSHFHILDLMTEMNDLLLVVFSIADYFPFLAPLDFQGLRKRTRSLAKRFDAALQDIIDSRLRDQPTSTDASSDTKATEYAPDFLDLLLQSASVREGSTPQISDQNVKAALMNVFGGGVDTAALTIEWTLGELLANPTKMRKLKEELVQVVGTARLVEEADLASLPYLQAVVKETMRLHPIAPLLIPHSASKACKVMGYHIPANTIAYINAWAIGRDPNTWENPFEFVPERFEGKAMDVNGKHFELLPFGAGRRGCPGWMLGLGMVQIAVASLVQAFEWELAKELHFSKTCGGLVFTSSNPLIVKASPTSFVAHLLQTT